MDKKTLSLYDADAQSYIQDWLSQPTPVEVHKIAEKYFTREASTADVGSGSGRDTHWLNSNGYPCVGFDGSQGLLNEARARFPDWTFKFALLPALSEIESESFQNVLCETVLQHLPREFHLEALKNLLRIMAGGGTLSLSWRHPLETSDSREKDGRLYEVVDQEALLILAAHLGAECVHRNSIVSASSNKKIDQLVFRKI